MADNSLQAASNQKQAASSTKDPKAVKAPTNASIKPAVKPANAQPQTAKPAAANSVKPAAKPAAKPTAAAKPAQAPASAKENSNSGVTVSTNELGQKVEVRTEITPDGKFCTIKTVYVPGVNGQPGKKVITRTVSSKSVSTTTNTTTTKSAVQQQPKQTAQLETVQVSQTNSNMGVSVQKKPKSNGAKKLEAFFKNRFVLFGILILIIAASAFFMLLADRENYVRKAIGLTGNPFFEAIAKIFQADDGKGGFNINITSWFIMFIMWFAILAVFGMIWLKKPCKEKYAVSHELSMDDSKGFKKFNLAYYLIFAGSIVLIFLIFFLVFPYKNLDFTTAAAPLVNVFKSTGLFVVMLLIIPVCILILVLVFKLLVFLLSLIIGNVSRNVMSSQNYQEALSASQLAAAKIQQQVEEEARKKKEEEEKLAKEKEEAEKNKKDKESEDGTVGGGTGAGLAAGGFGNTTLGGHQKVMFPALTKLDASFARKKNKDEKATTTTKGKGKSGTSSATTQADEKVDLVHLVNGFQSYLANRKQLYYELNMLRGFVGGLACSRLLLLQGLSGTGKSTLPREFAEYTDNSATFYPVQATWRDKTDLVGYFSDFTGEYKETELLKTLYRANYTPKTVYLLVLDEANISRMEYYFADFLSVYEYPSSNWLVPLIQPRKDDKLPARLEEGKVRIPVNTWFVATVNIDDSTFTISDKVYDRAMVLDFNAFNEPIKTKYDDTPYPMTKEKFDEAVKKAQAATKNNLTAAEKAKFMKLIQFVGDTFDCKIGNRIMNQIANFVPVFVACGGSKDNALDIMFANKVLRKVDVLFESYVEDGLTRLNKLVLSTYGAKNFPLTIKTIAKIKKKFN